MRFFRNAIIFMFIFNHTHFMMHSKKLWRHKNNVVFFSCNPVLRCFSYTPICVIIMKYLMQNVLFTTLHLMMQSNSMVPWSVSKNVIRKIYYLITFSTFLQSIVIFLWKILSRKGRFLGHLLSYQDQFDTEYYWTQHISFSSRPREVFFCHTNLQAQSKVFSFFKAKYPQ